MSGLNGGGASSHYDEDTECSSSIDFVGGIEAKYETDDLQYGGYLDGEEGVRGPGLNGRLEDSGIVWSNKTVFMLIEQYRNFKSILDDKQHAKKPVWERISRNLAAAGVQVTPTQCSQKWRNMMLQRRIKRLKVLLGQNPTTRMVAQPWEELLEAVAPPVDDEAVAKMTLPQRAIAPLASIAQQESPTRTPKAEPIDVAPSALLLKCTQQPKRKRTEDAIKRSMGFVMDALHSNEGGTLGTSSPNTQNTHNQVAMDSPSGSSDPFEDPSDLIPPASKMSRMVRGGSEHLAVAGGASASYFESEEDDENPLSVSDSAQAAISVEPAPCSSSSGSSGFGHPEAHHDQHHSGQVTNPSPSLMVGPGSAKLDDILAMVQEMRAEQTAFQTRMESQRAETSEREERRLRLFEQFLGLFGQAVNMFLAFDGRN